MNKKKFLLVGLLILALFLFGNFKTLSFTPLSINPTQYIGNIDNENLPSTIISNEKAIIGDYEIQTRQKDQHAAFPVVECQANICNGKEIGKDKYNCPLYAGGTTTSMVTCESTSVKEWYGSYYANTCEPDLSFCDIVGNNAPNDPSLITCVNGAWNGDLCKGSSPSVKYIRSVECIQTDTQCGGIKVSGKVNTVYECSNQYDVYYKGKLVNEIIGEPVNGDLIINAKTVYLLQGEEVSSGVISMDDKYDLVATFMQTKKSTSFPRTCVYTTNEFIIPIFKDTLDINVSRELNNINVDIKNNRGEELTGKATIKYSLDTVLGTINKEKIEILTIPKEGKNILIPIDPSILKENIDVNVKVEILSSTSKMSGLNIPSHQCYDDKGDKKEQSGKLINVASCSYVKIGETEQSFKIVKDSVEIKDQNIPTIEESQSFFKSIFDKIINFIKGIFTSK